MNWDVLAANVLEGHRISREQALEMLRSSDDRLEALLSAAERIRSHHFGREVHLHVLHNARRDLCPEDCSFCSQSSRYDTGIGEQPLSDVETLVEAAHAARVKGAARYCMVTATRGPSNTDLDVICEAVRRIKTELPGLEICTSLGLLNESRAHRLADAGVDRYNHNLETSERHFPTVTTTHSYADRVDTVQAARSAGMEACCGGIVGLGETLEDRVELAFALADLGVASVPLNFLDPRAGTPMEGFEKPSAEDCLRTLAMFRFVHPDVDLRVAGGREVCLGDQQPRALRAANSMFLEGYLTTPGQGASEDARMLAEAGYDVVEMINR
jgi:biotin synthase